MWRARRARDGVAGRCRRTRAPTRYGVCGCDPNHILTNVSKSQRRNPVNTGEVLEVDCGAPGPLKPPAAIAAAMEDWPGRSADSEKSESSSADELLRRKCRMTYAASGHLPVSPADQTAMSEFVRVGLGFPAPHMCHRSESDEASRRKDPMPRRLFHPPVALIATITASPASAHAARGRCDSTGAIRAAPRGTVPGRSSQRRPRREARRASPRLRASVSRTGLSALVCVEDATELGAGDEAVAAFTVGWRRGRPPAPSDGSSNRRIRF